MPTRVRRTIALVTVGAAALVVLAGTPPAAASCAEPPPLEDALADAPIAFLGTAVDVQEGTLARFQVHEVWSGPELIEVTVRGGEGAGITTSVDRTFVEGERYLVLPYADGADLRDNACTRTQVWDDDLARFRPADARTVDASAGEGEPAAADGSAASSLPWLLAALGALALTAAGAWGITRRTR